MALIQSLEKNGNFLFRHRGQIPVILFIAVLPVLYFDNSLGMSTATQEWLTWVAILVSFAGFIVRAITIGTTPAGTSGRNTEEQVADTLNRSGIYSTVRHPLYLGNWLMWAGIVIFTFNLSFFIIISLAFWLYYERIMFAEERYLERKFGNAYITWSEKVPAFVPRLASYKKNEIPFSLKSVLRREYSGFLATVFSFAYIDHLRYFFETGYFDFLRLSTYIFGIALVITLILRSLKHYTHILDEAGRS